MGLDWGLLWYDADGPMEDRVRRAAACYEEKHGEPPNICFVQNTVVQDDGFMVDGCKVIGNPTVLKNHIWIGVNDD